MRYDYEFKRKAVELYRQGNWPETPENIKHTECFHAMIRRWARIEDANGPEALRHKIVNKVWTPEEKLELVIIFEDGILEKAQRNLCATK